MGGKRGLAGTALASIFFWGWVVVSVLCSLLFPVFSMCVRVILSEVCDKTSIEGWMLFLSISVLSRGFGFVFVFVQSLSSERE